MKIQWFGNSTFLIQTSIGIKILLDPFDLFLSPITNINSDIIILSKNIDKKEFNNCSKIVYNNDFPYNNSIKIKSYESFSDSIQGLKRGKNIIHTLFIDNFKICHLGYLGHNLNSEMINLLKDFDFVFTPIGGNICIDGCTASKLINSIKAKYVIPMCFNNTNINFYSSCPKIFLKLNKSVFTINDSKLFTENLPSIPTSTVILLN